MKTYLLLEESKKLECITEPKKSIYIDCVNNIKDLEIYDEKYITFREYGSDIKLNTHWIIDINTQNLHHLNMSVNNIK